MLRCGEGVLWLCSEGVCNVSPLPSPGYMLEVDSRNRPDIFQVAHVVFAMKEERNPVHDQHLCESLSCLHVCVCIIIRGLHSLSPSLPSPPTLSPPRVKGNDSPYQEEASSLSSPLT